MFARIRNEQLYRTGLVCQAPGLGSHQASVSLVNPKVL